MSSFLDVKDGIYDPSKRFAFTNITDEPFTFSWNSNPINVKAGGVLELPHHLAILATQKLVDQIMNKLAHEDTERMRKEKGDYTARSPLGIAIGVPAARKPWEDKILRELKLDEENPQVQVMRAQIKDQLMKDITDGQKAPAPVGEIVANLNPKEFSDIGSKMI